MGTRPTRDEAVALLKEYTKSDALIKHAFAVEGVMRHFAGIMGGDPDEWGMVGILHDLDYEMYPDEHCAKVREILEERGVNEKYIRAVQSHGYGLCSDVLPESDMEKVLYAIDELTGLINAAAIMRPSKSVMDIELGSVKKKYKDAKFAAGVDRSVIENGCAMLGMELDYVITETIMGMRTVAEAIGLLGNPA